MKSILKNRHRKDAKPFDGVHYNYYDIESRTRKTITKEELQKLADWLPQECQRICRKVKNYHVSLSEKEQHDMLLLCSVSIYCWGGFPRCNMIGISMEDYANDFYIQMVHMLSLESKSGWDPNRAKWPAYVKFVRFKTIPTSIKRWDIKKGSEEAKNFHALNEECTPSEQNYDRDFEKLGITIDRGVKVVSLNRR